MVNILRVWSYFVRVIYTMFDVWKQAIISLTIYNVQDRNYTHELLDYVTNGICDCKAARLTDIDQNAMYRTLSFPKIFNTGYEANKPNR
jgi:hypothetical protein